MNRTHTLRRRRRTIDDTLRLNLAIQRRTIGHHSGRINQVQEQADRQDSALTDLGARIADLEDALQVLRQSHTP